MNIERNAFLLAMKAHAHQKYGDDPYMVHLFDVVRYLHRFGHNDEEMLAAAWLHDVIEDTPMNYNDVKEACGAGVADVVLAVTDEIGKNRRERKEKTLPKLKGNLWAQTIKLADWIANVQNAIEEKPKLLQMYQKDFPALAEAIGEEFDELMPMRHHLAKMLGRETVYPVSHPPPEPMSLMEQATHEAMTEGKLELLEELKHRISDAYSKTDIQSAGRVALRAIREVESEIA